MRKTMRNTIQKKIVMLCTTLFVILLTVAMAQASTVSRSFTSPVDSGSSVPVTLTVNVVGTEGFYIIDEILPAGFTVTNPGTGNAGTPGHLKWFVSSGVQSTTLTYTLTAPTQQGTSQFAGTYVFSSQPTTEVPIAGNTQIVVGGTPTCTPSWQCTAFAPAVCPQSGIQTRTCTDTNACGTNEGKPSEQQACSPEPSNDQLRFATFDGATTNFNSVPDVARVNNAVLEKSAFGKASFGTQLLNFTGLNLDAFFIISNNLIGFNPSSLPGLNVPATLTLYNINVNAPKILRDGVECIGCSLVSYENSKVTFTVPGFSFYSIVDAAAPIPTYTPDNQVNYIRGQININSLAATAGTQYILTITSGPNNGQKFTGVVDQNVPSSFQGHGYFDTRDQPNFNTGDSFIIQIPGSTASASGVFLNGGNGDFISGTGLLVFNVQLIPPEISNLPDKTINEDSVFTNPLMDLWNFTTDDQPKDQLIFSIQSQSNAALTQCTINNHLLECSNPPVNANGQNVVTVRVTDSSQQTDTDEFIVTVTAVNDAPVLDFIPAQGLLEDKPFVLDVNASDVDNDVLIFSDNTSVFNINAVTGLISFTPGDSAIGTHSVNISVHDTAGILVSQVVVFTINNVNDAPVLVKSIPDRVIEEDTPFTLNLSEYFTDVDNTYNQFSMSFNDTAHFDVQTIQQTADSLVLKFTPKQDYFGTNTVNLTVRDPFLATVSEIFTIEVAPINDNPVITPINDMTAIESVPFTYLAKATDVEDDLLHFYLLDFPLGPAVPTGVKIDAATGLINWTPEPQQVGTHPFRLVVNDSEFGSDEELFNVTVLSALDLADDAQIMLDNGLYVDVKDGSTIYAKPGDVIRMRFTMKNRIGRNIDDIIANISIIDLDLHLVNSTPRFNLWTGAEKQIDLAVQIPLVVTQFNYPLKIKAAGKEYDNTPRSMERNFNLVIQKDYHHVDISKLMLDQDKVRCYTPTTLDVTLTNLGHLEEDDVNLTLLNNQLGIKINDFVGYMDENQQLQRSYTVDLRNANPGTYNLDVAISYNNKDNATERSIPVVVQDCSLPAQFTVAEDTAPPANWIDLWQFTNSTVPGSAFDYEIVSQNLSLIKCQITKDASNAERYVSCDKPYSNQYGTSALNISLTRNFHTTYVKTMIVVTPANDAPTQSAPLPYTNVKEDSTYASPWKLQDFFTDIDHDQLSFSAINTQHISLTVEANGSVTVIPAPNFVGTENIIITATDGNAKVNATLVVNVEEGNDDAPVINSLIPENFPVLPADVHYTIKVNVSDIDSPALNIRWYVDNVLMGVGDSMTFVGNNSPGLHSFKIKVNVSDGTNMASKTFTIKTSDKPYSALYQINWTGTPSQAYLVIENPGVGRIEFLDPVDITKIAGIDAFVRIETGIAGVDTKDYLKGYDLSVLANKRAKVTLYGLVSSQQNVDIHHDTGLGVDEADPLCSECTNVQYDGSILIFEVESFSSYGVFLGGSSIGTVPSAPIVPDNTFLFGGPKQVASNPDEGKEVVVTQSFTIENTKSCTIGIQDVIVTPKLGFTADDLKIKLVSVSPTTIIPGQRATVQISARIPESLDAVDENLNPAAFNTADLTFKGAGSCTSPNDVLGVFAVMMQRENHLTFDKAEFSFGGNTEKVRDNDKVDNIKPGDDFDLQATVQNTFTEKEDISIDDIELRFIADDSDLDIDESEDMGRIGADDDDDETLQFEIESDADDGSYDSFLTAEGTDDYGARHGESWKISLKVEREDDEITIERADLSPVSLRCDLRTVFVTTQIRNTGKDDQDHASLTVDAPDLDYTETITDIQLDQDDGTSRTFGVIPPKDLAPGTYPITLKVFSDTNELLDTEVLEILVQECDSLKPQTINYAGQGTVCYTNGLQRPCSANSPCVDGNCVEIDGNAGRLQQNAVVLSNNKPKPVTYAAQQRGTAYAQRPQIAVQEEMSSLYSTVLIILFILAAGLIVFLFGAAIIIKNKRRRRAFRKKRQEKR